ncbi:MAG: histidine--tRNA ligase [Epsilonproteobacteria bacterium]|nr:histidine--tRNA ligase [Campylobacterota bacterium]NPA88731.1 histidine--tRNA ligase [Campylobacterota bacterium]
MIKKLRGMEDIFPGGKLDSRKFLKLADSCREVAEKYGFHYIETPILEETILFKRSVGESSDIVNKEMYHFLDRGGRDICLRPEGTAGVVRSFIENRLDRQGKVYRFWYFGPMFRYERPQKGRYRQFHQFGVESFGEGSVYEDIQTIGMAKEILEKLEIPYKLKINSLGCSQCAPTYRQKLLQFLESHREELCPDCQRRIETNPIRTLDCKNPSCQQILENAPKLQENLCSSCHSEFTQLKKGLEQLEIPFEVDSHLVRGLDYYTKTTFEFIGVGEGVGSQNAIVGGGRYDKLVEYLGGKPTPAVGFAIGIERILELLSPQKEREGVYLGALLEEGVPKLLEWAQKMRNNGEKVTINFQIKSLKSHLKSADKGGFKKVAIIGEEELKNDTIFEKEL